MTKSIDGQISSDTLKIRMLSYGKAIIIRSYYNFLRLSTSLQQIPIIMGKTTNSV
jgi:hypothetical protein